MLTLIVAVSPQGVIGHQGRIPWHLPADLRRFKQLTMGHHLLMGRKTFESLPRLLPGRTSVVLTRQADYTAPGAVVVHRLDEALQVLAQDDQPFVIGGADLYRETLPLADRLLMTVVEVEVEGDTFFPVWNRAEWELVEQAAHSADTQNPYPYRFEHYERAARR
jgi:dihydrofolate reductase